MTVQQLALRRKRAMLDFEDGLYLDAERELTELMEGLRDSDEPGAGYELGRALLDRATVRRFANRWDYVVTDLDACEQLALALPPSSRATLLPNVFLMRAQLHLTEVWEGHSAAKARAALDQLDAAGFTAWGVREARANLAFRERDWEEAAAGYRTLAAELVEQGWPRGVAACKLRSGTALLELGRADEAVPYVLDAQAYFAERGPSDLQADSERQLMRLLAAQGRFDQAWEHALTALALVEGSFRMFRSLFDQQRYLADKATYYEHAFAVGLAAGAERALTIAERSKSFYLTQLLATGGLPLFDGVDADDAARLRALEERLDELQAQAAVAPVEQRPAFDAEAHKIAAERDELFAAIMRDHPRWASAQTPAPFDASSDLALLPAGWVALSYFWLGDELHAFLARPEGEVVHHAEPWPKGDVETFAKSQEALRTASPAFLYSATVLPDTTARRLVAAELLERLESDERILVSPHGPLRGVPLQAGPLRGRAVQYIPSLALLRSAPPPCTSEGVLLLGCGQDGFASPPLPGVADELDAVAAEWAGQPATVEYVLLGPMGRLGVDAPPPEAWDRYRYVEIACHGILHREQPLEGALLLGRDALRMSELFDARLDADLVCLSACDLGQLGERVAGVAAAGDEWLGFTMPLLSAGARSILVSLWKADDRVAARLMAALHRALRAGAEPAGALRAALTAAEGESEAFWSNWYLVGFPAADERSVGS